MTVFGGMFWSCVYEVLGLLYHLLLVKIKIKTDGQSEFKFIII